METIESKVVTSSEHTKNDINELIIVKIDTISRDIESLKTKEIALTDDVNHLETERTRVNDKIIDWHTVTSNGAGELCSPLGNCSNKMLF